MALKMVPISGGLETRKFDEFNFNIENEFLFFIEDGEQLGELMDMLSWLATRIITAVLQKCLVILFLDNFD